MEDKIRILVESGYCVEEIAEQLGVSPEEINARLGLNSKGAAEENKDLEQNFAELEGESIAELRNLLRCSRDSVKADLIKFVLQQRMGMFKPKSENTFNLTVLNQFNSVVERGQKQAKKTYERLLEHNEQKRLSSYNAQRVLEVKPTEALVDA